MATTEGLRAERLARVNDAIQGSGYNQTEIARAMDVSKAAVSRWMTGASCPTRDKIVALEKLLGFPARSLVNGTTGAPSKSEEELTVEPLIPSRGEGVLQSVRLSKSAIESFGLKPGSISAYRMDNPALGQLIPIGSVLIVDRSVKTAQAEGFYLVQDNGVKRIGRYTFKPDGKPRLMRGLEDDPASAMPPETEVLGRVKAVLVVTET
jgi:transcriptional regulator with XRE-family HTH domain